MQHKFHVHVKNTTRSSVSHIISSKVCPVAHPRMFQSHDPCRKGYRISTIHSKVTSKNERKCAGRRCVDTFIEAPVIQSKYKLFTGETYSHFVSLILEGTISHKEAFYLLVIPHRTHHNVNHLFKATLVD